MTSLSRNDQETMLVFVMNGLEDYVKECAKKELLLDQMPVIS
jgi:hypothetical protein